jgi:hypothetical protein
MFLLDRGRAHDGAIARHLVGARPHGRHAQHDRVVTIIDRLDLEHRDWAHAAGIVSGPLAEPPLCVSAVGRHVAFQHDFRIGRKRESGHLAADHLHRPATQPPDEIELEYAIGRLQAAEEEEGERVTAKHHHDRQGLAALERLVARLREYISRGIQPEFTTLPWQEDLVLRPADLKTENQQPDPRNAYRHCRGFNAALMVW